MPIQVLAAPARTSLAHPSLAHRCLSIFRSPSPGLRSQVANTDLGRRRARATGAWTARLPSKSLDAPATMAASVPMLEGILLPSRALCRCVLASSLPHSSAVLTPAGSVRSQRCSANGMAPPLPRTAGWARPRPPACGVTARCRKAGRAGPPALAWRPCTLYHHVGLCACIRPAAHCVSRKIATSPIAASGVVLRSSLERECLTHAPAHRPSAERYHVPRERTGYAA